MSSRVRTILDVVTTVVILATCVALLAVNWSRLWPRSAAPTPPKAPVSLAGAAVRGDPAAPIVVIEYGDYQCRYCAAAEQNPVRALDAAYVEPGKVQVAFRQHPLEQLHPLALEAAEAAVCAGRQGQFWQMHAALYGDQKHLDEPSLVARAQQLGLNVAQFKTCLAAQPADQVRADSESAETLGLTGTPAFLIGVRQPDGRVRVTAVLTGARPFAEFQKAIDPLLAAGDVAAGRTWPGLVTVLAVAALAGSAVGILGWARGHHVRSAEPPAPAASHRNESSGSR